jgi:general nucleoside transport system ATP-binding protein
MPVSRHSGPGSGNRALDEIMELADRIVVMREGRIVHETPASGADLHTIGGYMAGHH